MSQQASENLNITNDLNCVFRIPHTTIRHRIDTRYHSSSWSSPFSMVALHPDTDLILEFFIDPLAQVDNKDLFTLIEEKISDLLTEVNGAFLQRWVCPFTAGKPMVLTYTVKIESINELSTTLSKFARDIADKEFTEELEKKLLEN